MGIRAWMQRIVTVQGTLAITVPSTISIAKVWNYIPPSTTDVPELPAMFNRWTFDREERGTGIRGLWYTVEMQFFAALAGVEDDIAADIATAFHDALVAAFDADVHLNAADVEQDIRGGGLAVFDRAGKAYIGWNCFMDIHAEEAQGFAR